MPKITFMGAGSTVFVRNVLGDCLNTEALKDAEFALYDIDAERLKQSEFIVNALNKNLSGRAVIKTYLGPAQRKSALEKSDFIINAIQVGGYDPATITDFEIPKKYGLQQTIGDTLGIGGIFRGLRTIPVMWEFASEICEVAPEALFLNYTNPMAILTGAMLHHTPVRTVGLCHSVQVCVESLLKTLDMDHSPERLAKIKSKIAGINHMAWLLEISENGRDLYPELKAVAAEKLAEWRKSADKEKKSSNMIRLAMMLHFGFYVTESSEHNAEYAPYWIKSRYPQLIDEWNIPLDEYPRRCRIQMEYWQTQYQEMSGEKDYKFVRSREYGADIINAVVTDKPFRIGGNIINHGMIPNLPADAVVEVPCMVDRNGIQPCFVGNLPIQCAAMNITNINPQMLTIQAAATGKKEYIYQAAMLDPHTAAELSIDDITALCDDLIEAHGDLLPAYH